MSRGRTSGDGSSRFANSATSLPGRPQHHSSTSGCLPSWGTSAAPVQPRHPDMTKSDEVQRWKRDHCINFFFFFYKSARTTFSRSPGQFPHPAALTLLARAQGSPWAGEGGSSFLRLRLRALWGGAGGSVGTWMCPLTLPDVDALGPLHPTFSRPL